VTAILAALSYIIAGELIKGTDPVKASSLFEKADNQELALMKAIKDEDDLDPENIEEIFEYPNNFAVGDSFTNINWNE
jgi:ADP-dependent phosphofructokinase/glucokinase